MLKILFLGDINGEIGRKAVKKILPKLKKELKPDLIIGNAENIAHGKGATEDTLKELMKYGISYFTMGDHAFDKDKKSELYETGKYPIVRPANFPDGAPGVGFTIIEIQKQKVLLINLLGRVFMHMDYDCPFHKIDEILALNNLEPAKFSAIIVDMHAEATSEKIAMGHYLNGRVSMVLGTHTHVMTADQKISSQGTGYISDVGMVGAADGVIGVEKESIIKTFLTQIKSTHVMPETGKAILNGLFFTIDSKTKKTVEIKSIIEYTNIK
jgi:metallophosphoesterase (TIGR00282 family)